MYWTLTIAAREKDHRRFMDVIKNRVGVTAKDARERVQADVPL